MVASRQTTLRPPSLFTRQLRSTTGVFLSPCVGNRHSLILIRPFLTSAESFLKTTMRSCGKWWGIDREVARVFGGQGGRMFNNKK